MLINKANLDFLFNTWDQRFQTAFQTQKTWYQEYASEIPSTSDQSVHSWLARQPGMREWVGNRIVNNVVARDYTLKNKDYEATIGLDRNRVKDDTHGLFAGAVDGLAIQTKLWPDDVMSTVVEAGDSTACWDGQNFFDTDHPVDIDDSSKGTYSNNLVGSSYDLNANPVAAYAAAKAIGARYLGDDLRPLSPTFDLLMVPPELENAGLRVAQALTNAQTIKNVAASENVAAAGVDNVYRGAITLLVNPRLQVANAWYLMDTKRGVKPFLWQLRQAAELVARNAPTDPSVFDAKTFLYGVDGRGAGGYGLPWLAVRAAAS